MRAQLFLIVTVLFLQTVAGQQCSDIQEWGFACQDCETMVSCIESAGSWKTIVLGNCDKDKKLYCNRSLKKCSETQDCAVVTEVDFTCNSPGIFPDPYKCASYYACSGDEKELKATKLQCPKPSAFSPKTNDCSARDEDEICRKRQFKCDNVGDSGVWPGNANIFYICVEKVDESKNSIVYPTLFRCALGEIFDGKSCIKSSQTSPTTTIPPKTTTQPEQSQKCSTPGLSPDPTDCRAYYFCNILLMRTRRVCPPNTMFNNNLKMCVFGNC